MAEDANLNFEPELFFDVQAAAQPGAHAPAGFISPEYEEEIVSGQISYFERGEKMSAEDMESLQVGRLRELLSYAGEHVPYWRSLFRDLAYIEGRIQDYLVALDGSLVPAAPVLFDYNFDYSDINQFQVAQVRSGYIEFKIVPNELQSISTEALNKRVIDGFSRLLGLKFTISVSIHQSLGCGGRGKFRYVDQAIKIVSN